MFDGLGSVVSLTDSNGNQANNYNYDPYGNTTTSTGTAPNYFGYASGYNDDGGLIHFGARYYDPSYGRWTQQDPVRQESDLSQADRYTYAGDDPINNADTNGYLIDSALKWLGNRMGAGQHYYFSPKLQTRAAWGTALRGAGRLITGYTIFHFANNCANRLTGGGLEGHDRGSCNPLQLVWP